jgi:hypothetical protein
MVCLTVGLACRRVSSDVERVARLPPAAAAAGPKGNFQDEGRH